MVGALKGETINITCNVLGDPPPRLVFQINIF